MKTNLRFIFLILRIAILLAPIYTVHNSIMELSKFESIITFKRAKHLDLNSFGDDLFTAGRLALALNYKKGDERTKLPEFVNQVRVDIKGLEEQNEILKNQLGKMDILINAISQSFPDTIVSKTVEETKNEIPLIDIFYEDSSKYVLRGKQAFYTILFATEKKERKRLENFDSNVKVEQKNIEALLGKPYIGTHPKNGDKTTYRQLIISSEDVIINENEVNLNFYTKRKKKKAQASFSYTLYLDFLSLE